MDATSSCLAGKIMSLPRWFLTMVIVLNVVSTRTVVKAAYQDRVLFPTENDLNVLHHKWHDMEDKFLAATESLVRQVLPNLVRMSSAVDISTECTASILKTLSALKDGKKWAFDLIDATGKPMGGQLYGTISFFGSYDQCLNTTAMNPWEPGKEYFRGKYCLVRFRPPMPPKPKTFTYREPVDGFHNLTFKSELFQTLITQVNSFYSFHYQMGLCVPSVCTNEDVHEITSSIAHLISWESDVHSCEIYEQKSLDRDQIAVIIVICIFIGLAMMATALETSAKRFKKFFNYDKLKTTWKLLRAFSIRLNTKKVFDDNGPGDSTFSCLNGLRFLSIGWVVVIHVYSQLSPQFYREAVHSHTYATAFSFQIITSGSLSVDTFFFITGLLVSYQIVSLVDKKGIRFFNVPVIIARRLWRLLPSAMMTLGLIVILPLLNSGPNWNDETGALLRATRENWWTVLACVSNFLPFYNMPMVSIWYISLDVQLFLMAMIILALLFKFPVASYTVMVALSLTSILASGLVIYLSKALPIFLLTAPDKEVVFDQFYYGHTLPHGHVSVYIIGMAMGIYFARTTIPIWSILVGWPVALALLFTALFSAYAFTDGSVPSGVESFFFAATYRTLWALGLAIMVFLCATRNGGFINAILSWKAFVPLNRLSYLVYLLHVLFITYLHGSFKGVVDLADHTNVWFAVGTIGLSYFGAYFMKIIFEAPLAELEKILLEKLFTKKMTDTPNDIKVVPTMTVQPSSQADSCKL